MQNPQPKSGIERSRHAAILAVLGVMAAIAGGILFISSPTNQLLGESSYGIRGALHGLVAGIFMITLTIGLYEAFRLWAGLPVNIRELELGSVVNAFMCLLTVVSGNWVYIPYRAAGGPKEHFLKVAPEIHKIFFEFKEYAALFTLPLLVAATYILCRYSERVAWNRALRDTVALLLVLAFFYFSIAWGLGAAVTKLKAV